MMKNKLSESMGRKKRKVKPEEIILVILFTMIGVGSIFFGSYMVRQYEFSNASRGFYSDKALGIYGTSSEVGQILDAKQQVMEFVLNHKGVTVNRILNSGNKISFATAFSGDTFIPPVLNGRYFTPEDFTGDEKLCVLGKDYYQPYSASSGEALVLIDGQEYITLYDVLYRVIGRVGYELDSPVNTALILNLNSQDIRLPYSGGNAFVLDAANSRLVKQAEQDFYLMMDDLGGSHIRVDIPTPSMSAAQFFNMDLLNLIMILFGAFAIVLATVPLTLLWSQRRRKTVAIKRLLGFSGGYVAAQMLGRLMILFNIGFLISYVVYNVIARIWYLGLRSFFSREMLIAYFCALAFNLMIAVVPLIQTMKVEPGDALRKE